MSEQDGQAENSGNDQAILIIANRPKSFESAANFLSRRGHPCSAVSNIKQAFKILTEQKPGYVFLSWNLKNSNTLKTVKLITTTFNSYVVVFAEVADSKTAAELASARLPEIMQAPVSGPGIYMKIQRIIKAKEEAESSGESKGHSKVSSNRSEEKTEVISVSASDVPQEGEWERKGRDEKTGQDIWSLKTKGASKVDGKSGTYTFKGDKPPVRSKKGGWATDEGEISFEAKVAVKKPEKNFTEKELEELASQALIDGKSLDALPAEDDTEDDEYGSIMKIGKNPPKHKPRGEVILQNGGPKKEKGMLDLSKDAQEREDLIIQKGQKGSSKQMQATQEGPNANEYKETQEAAKGKQFSLTQEGNAPNDNEFNKTQKGPSANSFNETQQGPAQNKHNLTQKGQPAVLGSRSPKANVNGKSADSVLARSILKSLQESLVYDEQAAIEEIGDVKKVAVMTINSQKFQGYLVATSSQEEPRKDILETLKDKIGKYLNESGEFLKDFEHFDITIEQVNFKAWSDQFAEFIALAPHQREQWGLAFFPFDGVQPNIEKKGEGMVAVDVVDVLPEALLGFDLFIHFPINNRYFLYCKNGQYISENQRTRMQKAKVHRFFIKESDVLSFQTFCVKNRVNGKVVEYKKFAKSRSA